MPQTPSTTYSAIDVVYTYLNGENQCYRKKYAAATGTDINDIRCVDHGELAFSVDLMLRHLPWVRTVHIVYGGNEIKQETLRALEALSGYRRLNLVPQEDVLPAAYRGTFSSCTVEAYLHRIEGLSEWFFYLNDDMCVGRPMVWADFFDAKANRPFIDLSRRRTDVDYNQAQRHNTNALRLFQSRHDTATERVAVSHQASLLHRPSCEQALRLFADELAACHREPFRTDSTLNFQLLASLVAERDRRATIRVGRQHHGILCVMAECQAPLMEFILTYSPQLFCINSVNKEHEARYKKFTQDYIDRCVRRKYHAFASRIVPNVQPQAGRRARQQAPRFRRVLDLPSLPEPTQRESEILIARYTRADSGAGGTVRRAEVLSVSRHSERVCVPDPPRHRPAAVQSLRRARRQAQKHRARPPAPKG